MNTGAETGATRPKPGAPRTAMVAMERPGTDTTAAPPENAAHPPQLTQPSGP